MMHSLSGSALTLSFFVQVDRKLSRKICMEHFDACLSSLFFYAIVRELFPSKVYPFFIV